MPKPSASATPMKTRPNCASEALGLRKAHQKKLTEYYTDADRGGARADRGETCTYKSTCCGIHFTLRDFDERATDLLFKYLFSGPDELRR